VTRGTLVGSAWWPINRLGRFTSTGARVGVWAMGPNDDGGGRGDLMASRGSAQKQRRLSLRSI
jgi:hypothetical protein